MKLSGHMRIAVRAVKYLFSLSRGYFFYAVAYSMVSGLLPYVPVFFSAKLIDALWGGAAAGTLYLYAALTVGIVFLLTLLRSYISYHYNVAYERMYRNEEWKFAEKAMEMAYASIEDPEVARLRRRIQTESQTGFDLYLIYSSAEGIVYNMTQIVMSVSLLASFFAIGAIPLSMKLLFAAGILLTVVIGVFTAGKREKQFYRYLEDCVDYNVAGGKLGGYIEDYKSAKDIRLYGMSDSLWKYQTKLSEEICRNDRRMNIRCAFYKLADVILNHGLKLGTYLMLLYGAYRGGVTVGSVARYVSCVILMLSAVSELVSHVQKALVNHKYLERYFSYLDIPNDMYQGSLTVEKRDDNEYYVEFRDVSFRYPNTESYALRHINLKFRIGEKLAVVGTNGSGKTTFIKLLCRLYDPSEGVILLNGVDIRKYDYDEYRSIFAVMFQDFSLFSFSLGQNVAAGSEYDRKRAEECLRKAGFAPRLAEMPDGLDTCLYKDYDKDGVQISGGEAQKIAMARALYKDCPFIVLDEPTAALDPVSEYEVYSGFNRIAGDKTTVYISHRLASCRFCDKIAVFEQGRIVQTGSHEELLAVEDGKYHELWTAQAQYYSDND